MTLLTGRKWVKSEDAYREETPPYDQASVDVAYILRAMMFFEAGGGQGYTGLANGYQSFIDLSRLLKTDRAILLAQAPADVTKSLGRKVLRDGKVLAEQETRRDVFFRFLLPVARGE